MYKGFFCFLFTLLFYLNAKTQISENDTISVSAFFEEMASFDTLDAGSLPSGQPNIYGVRNKTINFLGPKDRIYMKSSDSSVKKRNDSILRTKNYTFEYGIFIRDCKFSKDYSLTISNMVFNKGIAFYEVSGRGLNFENCTFNGGLVIANSNSKYLSFVNCSFHGNQIRNNEVEMLRFEKCTFSDNVLSSWPEYESCRITPDNKVLNCEIVISECVFQKRKNTSNHDITPNVFIIGGGAGTNIKTLSLNKCDMTNQIIDLMGLKIEDNFYVEECKFGFPLNITAFSIPKNTNFRWNNKLQLCARDTDNYGDSTFYTNAYLGEGEKELEKQTMYDELISGYNMFFKMYKNRGDLESANACYVQMKSVQTRMLEYKYKKNKTLNNYFNLKINEFLAYFCDYGTNPAKSLIISMYIILYFSIFYFFFYSSWDKINRGFFIRKYKRLTEYLTSNKNLEDFYNEKKSEEIASFKNFKKQTLESKKNMPMLLHLLAWPLYKFSLLKFKVSQFIFRNSDVLKEEWQKQSRPKKIMKGGMVYLGVLIYLLGVLILRGINSIALSINTFSTLGFGDIPVTGISRYVAIIQGFIGWFLLSIFSVSLISQILQL